LELWAAPASAHLTNGRVFLLVCVCLLCNWLETTEEQQADRYVTVHSIISFCCWAGVGQRRSSLSFTATLWRKKDEGAPIACV
jgi:hypothetical protein